MSFSGLVFGASVVYIYYKYWLNVQDEKNRAAETVIPPQERKDPLMIKPTYSRPDILPPRVYVSSTFNPVTSGYTPVSDTDETLYEGQIKSLNIASRFHYG